MTDRLGGWSPSGEPRATPGLAPVLNRVLAGYRIGDEAKQLAGRSGRLLQIDCGDGAALVAMRSCGWQVFGIEADNQLAAIAARRQIEMLAELPNQPVDAIVLRSHIARVDDPQKTLASLRAAVMPAGLLQVDFHPGQLDRQRLVRLAKACGWTVASISPSVRRVPWARPESATWLWMRAR